MEYTKTIILLTFMCHVIQGYVKEAETMTKVLPAYAMTTVIDQLNSTRCQTEMKEFRNSVDRGVLWGMKMLDSSGKPSSGFMWGNSYWIGYRIQCEYISQNLMIPFGEKRTRNNSIYRNPAEEFPPFQLNFFSVHFVQNSTLQYHTGRPMEDVMVLGLCLPASCSEHEIETMLKKVFDDRLLLFGQLYSADFRLIRVSNMKNDYKWLLSGKIIIILFILAALFGTVVVGTLYDIFVYQKHLRERKELAAYKKNDTIELKNGEVEEREHDQENDVPYEMKPDNRIIEILICFSFYSSMKQIFKTAKGEVAVFHGLKFFTMIWIIVLHGVFYSLHVTGNKMDLYMASIAIQNQVISNGNMSVDTFFFIGGFLTTYGYLKVQGNKKKIIPLRRKVMIFISVIVKRYIRLTPAYLITILLVIVNFSWHEQSSLFYFEEPLHELCSKYWWRNLLYINNFFGMENMCMNWSWYIANDMHFFIFGMFVLILLDSNHYAMIGVPAATLLFSTFIRAYVTYDIKYFPTVDMLYETTTEMYIPPWMRIQPYIVGMTTAALLTKLNYKLHLSKIALAGCWCFGICCNCLTLFGTAANKNMSIGVSALYEAFSRLGWSVGIAWIVIACLTNNGGIVDKFLSLKYWVPFSRIMLSTYLLNPMIITILGTLSNYPHNIDFIPTCVNSLGLIIVTFLCAILLSAVAEIPVVLLLRPHNNSRREMK